MADRRCQAAAETASANWVVAFLAASAVAIIAALSFWLGMNGALAPKPAASDATRSARRPAGRRPAVRARADSAGAGDASVSSLLPCPRRSSSASRKRSASRPRRAEREAVHREHRARTTRPKAAAAAKKVPEKKTVAYSNPWKSDGVSGRMVRIGAYGSLEKGKKAWSQLAQLSPSFKRLPAVVTDLPSRTGRIYYWLQVGTTSQAHSEVLCQRMRSIGQSCLVVDLAGARGSGNERQPVGL